MHVILRSFDVKISRLMSRTSRVQKEKKERGRENAEVCCSSTKPTFSRHSKGRDMRGYYCCSMLTWYPVGTSGQTTLTHKAFTMPFTLQLMPLQDKKHRRKLRLLGSLKRRLKRTRELNSQKRTRNQTQRRVLPPQLDRMILSNLKFRTNLRTPNLMKMHPTREILAPKYSRSSNSRISSLHPRQNCLVSFCQWSVA